ncbi:MAG: polyhydroxyalkanoic acid system family protein [Casimicrobiaceae bacterium]
MAHLRIVKRHGLTPEEAKAAAEAVARDLRARFDLAYRWEGERITFERAGLSGELCVAPGEVRLDCRLGFVLSALKSAIEREVHQEFDRRFAG